MSFTLESCEFGSGPIIGSRCLNSSTPSFAATPQEVSEMISQTAATCGVVVRFEVKAGTAEAITGDQARITQVKFAGISCCYKR